MVRETKPLRQAAMELDVDATTSELAAIEQTKDFQQLLWAERHKYHKELASDPNRGRNSLVGQLMVAAQKLMDEGAWDKAAEVVLKIAKIEGHVGGEQVNVFAGLNSKDLAEIEKRLKGGSENGKSSRLSPGRVESVIN